MVSYPRSVTSCVSYTNSSSQPTRTIFSLGDKNEPATGSYLSQYIVIAAVEIIAIPILYRNSKKVVC